MLAATTLRFEALHVEAVPPASRLFFYGCCNGFTGESFKIPDDIAQVIIEGRPDNMYMVGHDNISAYLQVLFFLAESHTFQ